MFALKNKQKHMLWHMHHDRHSGWYWWTDDLGHGWKPIVMDITPPGLPTRYKVMAAGCSKTEITMIHPDSFSAFAEAKRQAVLYAMAQPAIGAVETCRH